MVPRSDPSLIALAMERSTPELEAAYLRRWNLLPPAGQPVGVNRNGNPYLALCSSKPFNLKKPNCTGKIKEVMLNGNPHFRCTVCRNSKSAHHGPSAYDPTIQQSGLPIFNVDPRDIVYFVFMLSKEYSLSRMQELVGRQLSKEARVEWSLQIRQLMMNGLADAPKVRGVGDIVEIDETYMKGRKKSNRYLQGNLVGHQGHRRNNYLARSQAIGAAASFTSVVVRSLRVLSPPYLFRVAFFTALGTCITYAQTNMSLSNGYGHGGRARSASHAGSWYSGNRSQLDSQLTRWLDAAGDRVGVARAIISPHAGYSYCGETAAYAFKQIVPDNIDRIFVFGPSHVVSLSGCALTTCSKYRTPLGDLDIDMQVNAQLQKTDAFESMDRGDEEAEHSIEMQLPFIAKIFEGKDITIVPILVGSISGSRQQMYGKIFARYIEDPKNLFVISSDFCHWGSRFHYTPYNSSSREPIHEQITRLDREGMDAIETLKSGVFSDYLKKTENTICGRNPILLMLQAAELFRTVNNHTHEFRFLKYSQSNKSRSLHDSSVSYAAGALFIYPNS